jgi:amino acid adenylation domain-containing protein
MSDPYLLHQLLAESAERSPHKEAVSDGERSLSYTELDRASNQVARALRASGVVRGDRVGIYLPKSLAAIVSIFGILKAGGVYVPLDPTAPAPRLAYIISNCEIRSVISVGAGVPTLKKMFPEASPLRTVILADDQGGEGTQGCPAAVCLTWREVGEYPETVPLVEGTETDLAYILYTSGSTGSPKGVMISQRNALTFINWAFDCFGLTNTDRLSNHAPFHFDLSIFDIFAAIKAGATIVLVPEGISVFPIRLAQFIAHNRITIWYSVPSVLTLLVLYGNLHTFELAHLRAILFAGEVFPVKYLRQLMALIPSAKYYNLYGPTETNVCTFYEVQEVAPERTDPVPIGKACANTEVFALNEHNRKVAVGEVGELYVRGPSLMKGYWGDPEKTAEVMVQNPLPSYGQDQVYRTGDLVRIDAEGNYIYVGRRDHMVKSRGYRIELGEIEAVLGSHADIKEAAVVAIPDELIGNRLKACIVAADPARLSRTEVEKYCAERLPRYMIPHLVEFYSALPKTSTGKIDRKALGSVGGGTDA